MAERRLDDRALDALLAGVAPVFPATPDLAPRVAAALAAPLAPPQRLPRPAIRLSLAAALLAAILVAGLAAAGAAGIGPLRILFQPGPLPSPNVPDTPLGLRLSLGERVTPAAVPDLTDLPIGLPADIGPPDEAYLDTAGIVTYLWAAGEELPALGGSDAGLLLMAIPGEIEPALVEKVVIESNSRLETVPVGGATGYWITGPPHLFRYLAPTGRDDATWSRLVGDALAWQEGPIVYRIESALGRDATVDIAASLVRAR